MAIGLHAILYMMQDVMDSETLVIIFQVILMVAFIFVATGFIFLLTRLQIISNSMLDVRQKGLQKYKEMFEAI